MWIQSHQELARHPKTKRAAIALSLSNPTMIGHLHLLWWWCLDFAQDGNLSDYTAQDIALASEWEGDPAVFLDAIINAGFVNITDGQRVVNDWQDYGGRLLDRKQKQREAQRAYHQRKRQNDGIDGVMITSSSDVDIDKSRVRVEESTTNYNSDVDTDSTADSVNSSSATPTVPAAPREKLKYGERELERIYAQYPRKEHKREALAAIKSALRRICKKLDRPDWHEGEWPPPDPAQWLESRTVTFAASVMGQKPLAGEKEYRRHPATWFNAASYSDHEDNWNRIEVDTHGGSNGTAGKYPVSASQRNAEGHTQASMAAEYAAGIAADITAQSGHDLYDSGLDDPNALRVLNKHAKRSGAGRPDYGMVGLPAAQQCATVVRCRDV